LNYHCFSSCFRTEALPFNFQRSICVRVWSH